MIPSLRLRFLKMLVNVPLRVVDRLLPEAQSAWYPQSRMLSHAYEKLLRVYRLDCSQGTFGAGPDGNFERFLRVSKKILLRVCEDDRYYRAWVGLGFIVAGEEMSMFNEEAAEVKRLIREQWLMDLGFLPDRVIAENKREFLEVALCDYLGNLADLREEDWR